MTATIGDRQSRPYASKMVTVTIGDRQPRPYVEQGNFMLAVQPL